jgi:hypothetical protein
LIVAVFAPVAVTVHEVDVHAPVVAEERHDPVNVLKVVFVGVVGVVFELLHAAVASASAIMIGAKTFTRP